MPHNSLTFTPEQENFLAALTSSDQGLALDAVAGSAKTTMLVAGTEQLPDTTLILALAFNKEIQTSLRERMGAHIVCRTLNAHGLAAWRNYLTCSVYTNPQKTNKIAQALAEKEGRKFLWWDINKLAQAAKSAGIIPPIPGHHVYGLMEDTAENWESLAFDSDIERWQDQQVQHLARETLIESNSAAFSGELDFADHLYLPICLRIPVPKYDVVFVDEAQDLNYMQHLLVERSVRCRLIAVGDPHQAIYGWRGALTDSMALLIDKFKLQTLPLSVCFRCGSEIVKEAQQYVPHMQAWENSPEGQVLHASDGFDPTQAEKNDVVLCRNNAPLVRVAYSCIRQRIPVQMRGRDIGASLSSLLRQVSKRKDPSNHTIKELRSLVREWYAKQRDMAIQNNKKYLLLALEDRYLSVDFLLSDMSSNDRGDAALRVIKQIFAPSLGGLLLSTIHRAKGLEFPRVWWLDNGNCPSFYAERAVQNEEAGALDMMQQEYNLRYVATTRAKDKLIYTSSPKREEDEEDD